VGSGALPTVAPHLFIVITGTHVSSALAFTRDAARKAVRRPRRSRLASTDSNPHASRVPSAGMFLSAWGFNSCRRGDLNPHALSGTGPSSQRVCLFRHSDLPRLRRGYRATGMVANRHWHRTRRSATATIPAVAGNRTARALTMTHHCPGLHCLHFSLVPSAPAWRAIGHPRGDRRPPGCTTTRQLARR
jgi:hypothetical protein